MRMRSALAAALLSVSAVATIGSGSGHAGAGGSEVDGRTRPVTVTGVLERVVVNTSPGEHIRYAVRGANRTWWLDGIDDPAPAVGSVVHVSGTPRDAYSLTVDNIRVSTAAAAVSAATPRSTRVLVLRVYWGTRPPATPTMATTTRSVITDSRAWFQEVSHGRYTVSGTVTPWLKVRPPQDCFDGAFAIRDQALAAARRRGYDLSRFGRFVVYVPCSTSAAGLGYMPGKYVWLFNTLGKTVVMHEQGHNLGLPHASLRVCQRAMMIVTWSSNCLVLEYGDVTDTMGSRWSGHYNAYSKSRLGWLQRSTTATSTRTLTLAPYETTGPGVKAIRLRAGSATYWLEYRRGTGADSGIAAGAAGVQIRLQAAGGRTQVLDASPESYGYDDFIDTHLPAGSSWTTPQRVRITVTSQTSSGATVAIRFGAPAPRPPAAPGSAQVQVLDRAVRVTWTRPADNGAIIRHYTIVRSDGATRTVRMTGGTITNFRWEGLDPKQSYTFGVNATNEVGRSPTSRAVRREPSVVITSPVDGAIVRGVVPVEIEARASSTTSPIEDATLYVDGQFVDRYGAPLESLEFDTRLLPNGPHTIKVIVEDVWGDTAGATRTVNVSNPTPPVTITSPQDGATVAGQFDVVYAISPASDEWGWATLFIDGVDWGGEFVIDTTWLGPGSHTLEVEVSNRFGRQRSLPVSVTVPDPEEVN